MKSRHFLSRDGALWSAIGAELVPLGLAFERLELRSGLGELLRHLGDLLVCFGIGLGRGPMRSNICVSK